MNLCFLDLETTGFEPQKDSIIECSLVRFENQIEVARVDQVYKPDKSELTAFITHLTGINQEEIDLKGLVFADHKEVVAQAIGDAVIVGHNIDFDINFLIGNGIDLSQNPRIDTHELARILMPLEASFALEVLSRKLGFLHKDAHRAMSDVLASKDLYEYLLNKIDQLPTDFREEIKPFLESKTDWYAKNLFLEAPGSGDTWEEFKPLKPTPQTSCEIKDNIGAQNYLVQIDDHNRSAETLCNISATLDKPSLIISPKLDFFESCAKFPTPEVLFDRDRLESFAQGISKLDDQETTFYLKCALRHACGYRGLFQFDLFFQERDLWSQVCIQNEKDPKFQSIITEKSAEKSLALSPEALFRFIDLPIFKNRTLIFDEAEFVAERLLQFPAQNFELKPFLSQKDDQVATKAQFVVTRFCKEFLESKLGHQLSPFPQKITLENDNLASFWEDFKPFIAKESQEFWKQFFDNTHPSHVRWITYMPDGGNLIFSSWDPQVWRDLKAKIATHQVILAHRNSEINTDFWPIFYGFPAPEKANFHILSGIPKLIVPEGLVSVKSPEFNDFCADKMQQILKDRDHNVCFNFSSLETMRGIFDTINQDTPEDTFFTAERIVGGDGKLLQMLIRNQDKKIGLCYQKIMKPQLEAFDFQTLVIQKFPFTPPHPLLAAIENKMKQSGKNFWDLWVIPQMVANLSRRMGSFPNLKEVYFLDARENSRWGKSILEKVFR